ncbi:glycosyltransferase family 2 protein [Pontibacter sp. BT731]|uniref:glycosyltransferase family 2 protein n=1 Tax=Pontibacter coccineus TaxID=3063328 RepID=UPI0026E3E2EA|nr:glycosyltransferase family 2 protein [Pontibacter sp. BT731]MDO6390989.1 glycosyltransferase family 2 protein [Pontibacter sp. BT731]
MESKNKFSVIVPIHNKLPHLERSVNSVLNQTFDNLELILVDDASSDGSSGKISEFKDPRIKVFRREIPGPGGYAARNLGITHATGEWICFLDADDEWESSLLETIHRTIMSNPNVELISWGWFITRGGIKILDKHTLTYNKLNARYYTLMDFLNGPPQIWTGAVSIKKDVLIKSGCFPENDFKRGGDMDTWIRCLWHSRQNIWLNRTLSYYHVDSVNMVTKNVERDISFIFSPFLQTLLEYQNPLLNKAIKNFQNRYLYILLNGNVYKNRNINYGLLKKMNLNYQGIWLIIKLHLNKFRLSL